MKCYDNSKENKFIMYLDASNLYGWAVSQHSSYIGFKWLNRKEINRFENSPIGYILEVDLNILMTYMNCIMIIH